MAELIQYRNQATSKDANGALSVVASRKVLVTRRGASVNGAQTGTLTSITVHSGALRFADNNVIQVEGDITKLAVVNGTPTVDTAIPIDSVALTVADNARLVNLGTDSSAGTGTPGYDGADALLAIYDEPLSTGTAIVDNQVTTDADGEYSFWSAYGVVDISIMDASNQLGANSQTNPDVPMVQSGEHLGANVITVGGLDYPQTDVGINKAIADTIESARQEVPAEQKQRVQELEATTYSTETGEKSAETEDRPRRRARRKRRPRPEVIAAHLKEGAPAAGGEAATGAPADAPTDAPADAPTDASADAPTGAVTEAAADAPEAAAEPVPAEPAAEAATEEKSEE